MSEKVDQGHTNEDIPILVVDDLRSARRIVVRLLARLGFTQVGEAENGADALKRLKEDDYLLVMSDLHLGDMTGTDLYLQIKSEYRIDVRPFFLVFTSDASKEEMERIYDSGITSVLLKPFSADQLVEKINEVLDPEG